MEWLFDPQIWMAFVTLTALEIILGIDNIIFIALVVDRLPPEQRAKVRLLGLSLALLMRILFLLTLVWITRLQSTLFTLFDHDFSARDLILLGGGLFLFAKSTLEIHHQIEDAQSPQKSYVVMGMWSAIVQIILLDIIFSIDSVITAIGMAQQVGVMIAAIIVAIIVMLAASTAISRFVEQYPTIKMLAISFLLLIGLALIADGLGLHIPKGYLYFAMAFSVTVEMLNIQVHRHRRRHKHN